MREERGMKELPEMQSSASFSSMDGYAEPTGGVVVLEAVGFYILQY